MALFDKLRDGLRRLKQLRNKVKDKVKGILLDWQSLCHRVTDTMSTRVYITAGCWLFLYCGLILTSLLLFLATGNPIIFITSFFLTSYFAGMGWM